LVGIHEWRAASGIAENQDVGCSGQTDGGCSRSMIDAGEDGQAFGSDLGFKPIHRLLWSDATENSRQSIYCLPVQSVSETIAMKLSVSNERLFPATSR